MKVPVPAGPYQRLVLSLFWILAILLGMRWYFIVILICISLMTCDGEHVFLCLFAICISSVVRCLLWSLTPFIIGLFVFLLLNFKYSLYILDNSPLSCMSFANILSQSVVLSSNSLDIVFHRAEVFNFNEVQIHNDFFQGLSPWYCI